jgi:hypothetical protein
MRKYIFALVALLASLSLARPALAEGDEAKIAETLFLEGRKLLEDGAYALACTKFAESQRLDPNTATLLNLGHCYEKAHKTASAWIAFREAAQLARRQSLPERAETAMARVAELEKTLAKLTVTAADPAGDLIITLDGTKLTAGVLGVPIPMDPGEHLISATAEGKKPWSTSVVIVQEKAHEIRIPPLVDAKVTRAPAPPPLPPVEPPDDDKNQRWVAGWVMLGVAGVGFGVAAVTGGFLLSKKDIIEEHCTDGVCDERGFAEAEDVPVLDIVGSAALALGVTASAVSLVLLLTTLGDDDDARLDWRFSPMVSADAAGGSITGSW